MSRRFAAFAALVIVPLVACSGISTPSHRATTYNQTILADSPVAFWNMNSTTATETDLTGNGHTGTYKGGQPTRTGLPNTALSEVFNGSSEYMTVPSAPDLSITNTGELTWEAWIKPTVVQFPHSTGGYVDWMGKCQNYSPTCEWEARMYNQSNSQGRTSRLSAYVFNPTAGLGSGADWQPANSNVIQAGKWYYVVGEYQTLTQPPGCNGPQVGGINIWVDGVEWDQAKHLQTGCLSQYGVTPQANNSPLNVAAMALDSFFKGAIGKVAIYDTLLSQAQINAHYTAMTGTAPPAGTCNYNNTGDCTLG